MGMKKNPVTGVMEWVDDSIIFKNDFFDNKTDLDFSGRGIDYSPKDFKADIKIKKDAGFDWENMFSSENLSDTLQGIGAVTSAVGSIYQGFITKDYQDELLSMEKKRVDREIAKEYKQQEAYDKVWSK